LEAGLSMKDVKGKSGQKASMGFGTQGRGENYKQVPAVKKSITKITRPKKKVGCLPGVWGHERFENPKGFRPKRCSKKKKKGGRKKIFNVGKEQMRREQETKQYSVRKPQIESRRKQGTE